MEWRAELIIHRDKKRIAIWFERDDVLIARMKKLAGACWSSSLKVWHLPNTAENRLRLFQDV